MRLLLQVTALFSLLFSIVPGVLGQSTSGLPTCVTSCLSSLNTGSCSTTDYACLCKSPQFLDSATACLQKACSADDLTKAVTAAQGLCQTQGVSISSSLIASATSAAAASRSASSASAFASAPATPTGAASNPSSSSPSSAQRLGTSVIAGLSMTPLVALALGISALL